MKKKFRFASKNQMKWISHRGNISGRAPEQENRPDYVHSAIIKGFDVEVDAWVVTEEDRVFLGHLEPDFEVDLNFFKSRYDSLWIHCKNLRALEFFLKHEELNCFAHSSDEPVVLTSQGIMWTNIGQPLMPNSICVLPEVKLDKTKPLSDCYGLCSDFVEQFKQTDERDIKRREEANQSNKTENGGDKHVER